MNGNKGFLFKSSTRITKVLLIVMAAILSTSVLTTFVFANDDNTQTAYQTTSNNIVSMDMIDSPKSTYEHIAPMDVYTDVIEDAIMYHSSQYQDSYRDHITTTYPDADITKLDEFTNTINGYNADLKAKFEEFQTIYEAQGYVDAYLLSEELTAAYVYNSTRYNYIASFINTYGDQYNDEIKQFLLSYLDDHVYYVGFMGYLELGHQIGEHYDSQKVLVSNLYDEVYKQVSEIKDNPDEINKMVADIMQESIMNWVYEVDIDYFKAYQAQVRLYLKNAKELGYVFNLDTNTIDFDWKVSNGRELILGDFLTDPYVIGYLSIDFLEANLNSDGTDFVSPEEVYEHPYIQEIIENQVMPYFTPYDVNDMTFYEKENILEISLSAITSQYYAISMPGAYSQPNLQTFNSQFVGVARYEYYEQNQKLPELSTWIPVGQTMTEYDQYRLLNYVKVPSVDLREETTETVTRTVHYIFEDGTSASEDVVQSTNFNIVRELISGKENVDVDTQTLSSLENPTVEYIQSDAKVLEPTEKVEELTVTKDSANSEITVVYPLEFTLNVLYVDEDGNTVADSSTISGRWNTQYSEKGLDINGYKLTQTPSNVEGVFGTNRESIIFVYKKVSEQELDKPDQQDDTPSKDNDSLESSTKETSTSSTIKTANSSPETGDTTMAGVWRIMLLGASLLVTGYLVRRKASKQ